MKKFGTFSGVFVPSFEAILGAVLFLLIPGLVGRAGMIPMLLVVALANTVTTATAFSISDCTTNLQNVGAGGMYAIAKRSLGKAFGGSIGIQLFIAQAASIGFYAIAFATPLQPLFVDLPVIGVFLQQISLPAGEAASNAILVNGGTAVEAAAAVAQGMIGFQIMVIASIIAFIAFLSAVAGADFVSKIQLIIFVILIVAIGIICITPLVWKPQYEPIFLDSFNLKGLGTIFFIKAFITFFPAVTGIDAGVGMSGSLKDPKRSLGKGTFMAIGITFLVYSGIVAVFGMINPEYSVGVDGETMFGADIIFKSNPLISAVVILGILVASGSSALSYFITAPRTAQTITKDGLLPRFMNFLGKDFTKKGHEPRWATVLTLLILMLVIWSGNGDVSIASMIVGICFLIVYGWINLAAFFERISGNPSFRPTSKGHWTISLYGFVLCMAVIGLWNPWVGILVFLSQLGIFLLLLRYKSNNKLEGVWWGLLFSFISWGHTRISRIIQGTKNWRPIVGIFLFADQQEESEQALAISEQIGRFKGMSLVNILKPQKVDEPAFLIPKESNFIEAEGDSFDRSVIAISQGSIPGGLEINTVILPLDHRMNLVSMIEKLIQLGKNVLLLKPGEIASAAENRIDVWWKGKENGNLMALLSYIISDTDRQKPGKNRTIRLIRKLFPGENEEKARVEMDALIEGARLKGEVLILPESEEAFPDTITRHSADASLILMGMPGQKVGGLAKMFSLDKRFFSKELEKYEHMPPVLFVKAAGIVDLLE